MQKTKKDLKIEEKIARRGEFNDEIFNLLQYFSKEHQELRFWQILFCIFGDLTIDRFYQESYDSLEIIKNFLKYNNKNN